MKRKHVRDYREGWWWGRYTQRPRPMGISKWWFAGYRAGQVAQMHQRPVSAPPTPVE